jgi:hypothetical protein
MAEAMAREMGNVDLQEALELVVLIVEKDHGRRGRACVRWLRRYLDERPDATLEEVQLASAALAALGGREHQPAWSALTVMAERATVARPRRRVAS